MIRTLKIRNLRSVKEITLDCRNINLLTGDNMSGKSTILDALRIESFAAFFVDILNEDIVRHGEETAEVFLTDTEGNTVNAFLSGKKAGVLNDDSSVINKCSVIRDIRWIRTWNPAAMSGQVWSTNHMQGLFENRSPRNRNDASTLCLSLYNVFREDFPEEVNGWLERIIGTRLDFEEGQGPQNLDIQYGYGSPKAVSLAGLIVFCLSAPKGAVLYIENPETGLSPRAQSELGRFLYHVADSGRQLFVETHSDHIFNSLRVGIVKGSMDPEKIAVDFFKLKDVETKCCPVEIDRYGNVSVAKGDTLDGFFDQFDKDLDAMLGL